MMKSMKEKYGAKKGEDIYYAVEQKNKMSKGGMPMHKMPDGTMMKGAKHGYAHGGSVACGASNPPSKKRV
jgi:hypothetical protein